MKKEIELRDKKIEYTFRPSRRAKKIWLTIRYDGSFIVSAPFRMSEEKISGFIAKKSDWILEKLEYFKKHPGTVLHENGRGLKEYKNEALKLACARLDYYNQFYGFKYKKISIRSQTTRWGSCSKEGNLSFNYQIALLHPSLSDYIVVHELCHLGEFNHSPKFWKLVERAIPNHKELRGEIRKIHLR